MIVLSEVFIHTPYIISQAMDFVHPSTYGKFVNSSLGGTESARASLMMFSKATFRSPRSTPPT